MKELVKTSSTILKHTGAINESISHLLAAVTGESELDPDEFARAVAKQIEELTPYLNNCAFHLRSAVKGDNKIYSEA